MRTEAAAAAATPSSVSSDRRPPMPPMIGLEATMPNQPAVTTMRWPWLPRRQAMCDPIRGLHERLAHDAERCGEHRRHGQAGDEHRGPGDLHVAALQHQECRDGHREWPLRSALFLDPPPAAPGKFRCGPRSGPARIPTKESSWRASRHALRDQVTHQPVPHADFAGYVKEQQQSGQQHLGIGEQAGRHSEVE